MIPIEHTDKPGGRDRHDWDTLAATGRDNPGEWFKMPVKHRSYATFIRQGKFAAFREDHDKWDVVTRMEDGQVYVYVCYFA